jgi:hypothetical protein
VYSYGKLCVPSAKTEAVIRYYHGAEHPSTGKLLDIVLHRCEFEDKVDAVKKLCSGIAESCHICQAVKPLNRKYGTLDFSPVPSQIFSSLCMDFVTLSKVTDSEGRTFDTVLVIVDRLSGYIWGISCFKTGLTAEAVAKLFVRHCVSMTGIPLEILSDNDSLITSKLFMSLCDQLGIEQHSSVIYRPQGKGRAERAVKSVINILRLTLVGLRDSAKWIDVLPYACFLQNSLPGVIAGYSPHQIVFGRQLLLPGELPSTGNSIRLSETSQEWFDKLNSDRKLVQERLSKIHASERDRYMKTHVMQKFEPGEKFWVKVLDKDRQKLDPLWMGPCEILRHVHGGRYTVKTAFGDEDHHSDSFKLYCPELSGTAIPFQYYKPATIPEDDNWTVDRILKHRTVGDRLQWLVLWKGHPNLSWEYAEQFVGHTQNDCKLYNQKHKLAVTFE